jgi:hypothetical protein
MCSQKSNKSDDSKKGDKVVIELPAVPPEVMRTVSERHNKGLMSPCIYQILTQVFHVVAFSFTSSMLKNILINKQRQFSFGLLYLTFH